MAACALAEKLPAGVLLGSERDLPVSPEKPSSPETPDWLWLDFEKHCVHPEFDLRLASRFTQLVTLQTVCPQVTSALTQKDGSSTLKAKAGVKVILRCLRLLHLCGYEQESIEVIAAHAIVYLEGFLLELGEDAGAMEIRELASILCVWMFIAHSYVEDKACKLKVWHQFVFHDYCPLATLNTVVLRLMELREFILRVEDRELADSLAFLCG